MKKCFFILGTTCSGKDYMIEYAIDKYPNKFGAVQVGKEFRKRYPPEHFKGSGAPDHTEQEALQIYKEQFDKNLDKEYILVSGQPRRPSQVIPCIEYCYQTGYVPSVVWLYTPDIVINNRIVERFKDNFEEKKLAQQRTINDKVQFYDTIFELLKYRKNAALEFICLDTRDERIQDALATLVQFGAF